MSLSRASILFSSAIVALGVAASAACHAPRSIRASENCPCTLGDQCCDGVCIKAFDICDSMPIGSSGSSDIATLARVTGDIACITQDDAFLYWMTNDGTVSATRKVVDFRLETGGTSGTPASGPRVLDSQFPIPKQPIGKCGLVVDENFLYVTLNGTGSLAKMSAASTGATTFGISGRTFGTFLTPSSIAVDGVDVYVTEYDSGLVKKVVVDEDAGAPVTTTLGQAGRKAHSLIMDGELLFWLDETGVRKMAKTGGAVTTLAFSVGKELVAQSGTLYWREESQDLASYLWSVPVEGGIPERVAIDPDIAGSRKTAESSPTPATASAIAVIGTEVFFSYRRHLLQVQVPNQSRLLRAIHNEDEDESPYPVRHLLVDATAIHYVDPKNTIWSMRR